ncbi:MAG: hypothetical protein ACFCUO_06705 [Rhodospirillales bacterium]
MLIRLIDYHGSPTDNHKKLTRMSGIFAPQRRSAPSLPRFVGLLR